MEEDKSDLLDLENNMEFYFDIVKGDKESFQKLKSWYEERVLDTNKPIESYKKVIFKIIEFAYNQNKKENKEEKEKETFNTKNEEFKNNSLNDNGTNSNITLEKILNQTNELKKKDKEKLNKINELKKTDEDKINKINKLKEKDEEKTNEINELKEKDEEKANKSIK